jgi:outer membrane receptor protein involved in Fe transport
MKQRSKVQAVPVALAGVSAALAFILLACGADVPMTPQETSRVTLGESVAAASSPEAASNPETASSPEAASGPETASSPEAESSPEAASGAAESGGEIGADDLVVIARTSGGTTRLEAQAIIVRRDSLETAEVEFDVRDARGTVESRPLIVVDGVIIGRGVEDGQFDIEALDIESIEIIRGNAASQLYGSRAVDGVINIRTVRPNSGN